MSLKKMVLLRRWEGKTLSVGKEDFSPYFTKVFKEPGDKQFAAIVGYASEEKTVSQCLSRLLPNGEMILKTPDFSKWSISQRLFEEGTITDVMTEGKEWIWRFVKDDTSKVTLFDGRWKKFGWNGKLSFCVGDGVVPFTDLFDVKVGAISGLDEAFISPDGNADFVSAQTLKSGTTKKMFYNVYSDALLPFKERLLSRKVRKFDESNWWMWGRGHFGEGDRIYVPVKTKSAKPFFAHPCNNYDGTVLGIFYDFPMKPNKLADMLNKLPWADFGFKSAGRLVFSYGALRNLMLPTEFVSCIEDLRCKNPS